MSVLEENQLLRAKRMAAPLPPDWTDWDTKYALLCAEEFEKRARDLTLRAYPDLELIREMLDAAQEARAIAAQAARAPLPRQALRRGALLAEEETV
jgi:hypothetical protein